jgi:hypothetical protein
VAAAAFGAIARQGVLGVDPRQALGERVLALGHGHEVDVVRHQTVAQDAHSGAHGLPPEKVQVQTPVVGRVEHRLAVVAALGDMVGYVRKNYAWAAGHNQMVG